MYNLDTKNGNTGLLGRYFWRIEDSNGEGALEQCLAWTVQNREENILHWYNNEIKSDPEMACPCTFWQAWLDWGRFSWEWWFSWPQLCFESRRSKFIDSTRTGFSDLWLRQECCYSTNWQDWGSLKLDPPDAGHLKVITTTFITDEEAYKYCCVDTAQCDLFYRYRPSDDCTLYIPPPRRTFYCVL